MIDPVSKSEDESGNLTASKMDSNGSGNKVIRDS